MKAEEILWEALQRSAGERARYVEEACGGDADLRALVDDLLQAHGEAGSFLETPILEGAPAHAAEPHEDDAIGPYRLLERLGEGGMGVVWKAQQSSPVRRTVALKLMRLGLASTQFVARFEAERQALALMDHPNVARVLDAGTSGGTPWFAMELVEGRPITAYCADRALPLRDRVRLFLDVCRGVQHAHQKGVIHRDLKPSNVLVAVHDGKPVPKVIDFGVAKAAGVRLSESTMVTQAGQVMGTVEYMSPEQACLGEADVDTRSDVYSLGVVLYELLTGTTPVGKDRWRDAGLGEILRIVREEEPPLPSARVAETASASGRSASVRRAVAEVRGDLDWIVMRCLEKDPRRRYESASALAADLERHLEDRPVSAGPPSAGYRMRKFVRRHPTATAASALGLVLLAGGVAFAFRVQSEGAAEAVRASRLEEGVASALEEARSAGEQAAKSVDDAAAWKTASTSALGAVRRAEALVAQAGSGFDAALRHGLEETKARAEADERDRRLLERVEELRLRASGVDVRTNRFAPNVSAAELEATFAEWGVAWGKAPYPEVAARIENRPARVRDLLRSSFFGAYVLMPVAERRGQGPWVRGLVEAVEKDPWRHDVLTALYVGDTRALERLVGLLDAASQSASFLAMVAGGDEPSGASAWRLALLREAQDAHPSDFWLNAKLGLALHQAVPPQSAKGVPYLTAALAVRPRNPGVWLNLGEASRSTDPPDLEGALRAYDHALAVEPSYAAAHRGRAQTLDAMHRYEESIAAFRTRLSCAPDDPEAMNHLGVALVRHGDRREGVALVRKAVEREPTSAGFQCDWARVLQESGDLAGAEAAYRASIALDPKNSFAHSALGETLEDSGRLPEAVVEYRTALDLSPQHVGTMTNYGLCLRKVPDLDGAIAVLGEAVRLDPAAATAQFDLALCLLDRSDDESAEPHLRAALAADPSYADAAANLAALRIRRGEFDDAVRVLEAVTPSEARPGAVAKLANVLADAKDVAAAAPRLPDFVAGKIAPKDDDERSVWFRVCRGKGLNLLASKVAGDRFDSGEMLDATSCREGAECAALAGDPRGGAGTAPTDAGRAACREQALRWLGACLDYWEGTAQRAPVSRRWHARTDPAALLVNPRLAAVRDREALHRMPSAEADEWRRLWERVERASKRPSPR
jgi:serine/threonine-protein kinase